MFFTVSFSYQYVKTYNNFFFFFYIQVHFKASTPLSLLQFQKSIIWRYLYKRERSMISPYLITEKYHQTRAIIQGLCSTILLQTALKCSELQTSRNKMFCMQPFYFYRPQNKQSFTA